VSYSDIVAGRGHVVIGADDSELAKGLNRAARKLKDFGENIRAVGLGIGGAGAAIFTPLAGAGEAFASHGSELEKGSKQTGIGAESLSTLQYAAQQANVDFDTLTLSIARMNKNLGSGEPLSGKLREALTHLHLSVSDLVGLKPDERFKLIAQRLSEMRDAGLQANIANEIFGRGFKDILPLIDQGSAGINGLQDRARQLGLQWSDEDAKAADELRQSLNDLWDVMRRLTEIVGSAVAPVMKAMVGYIVPTVNAIKGWVDEHRELFQALMIGGAALVAFGGSMVVLGTTITSTASVLTLFAGIVTTIGSVLGGLLSPIAAVGMAIVSLGADFLYLTKWGQATRQYLSGAFAGIKADALLAFDGIKGALMAGDWALAAQILWTLVKLEFAKGVNALEPIYQAMKANVVDAFIQAGYGIRVAWGASTNFVSKVWFNMIADLESLWDGFCDVIGSTWDTVSGGIEKGMNDIHAAWAKVTGGSFDAKSANAAIDRRNSDRELQRTRSSQSAEAAREAELQKQLDDADKAYDDAMAKAKAARDSGLAATDKTATNAAETAAQKVEQLRKQLDELHKQASDAGRTSAMAGIAGPAAPDAGDLSEGLKGASEKIYGQFGGQGASQLGGGSNEHAKKTADNTGKMAALMQAYLPLLKTDSHGHKSAAFT
jgi:hypothetical protein